MRKLLSLLLCILATHFAQAQCVAGFNWTATPNNTSPLQVTFTNTGSWTGSTSTLYAQYHYSFGDGTSSNGPYQQHNYSAPGSYFVVEVMTVYDSLTNTVYCSDSATHTVSIAYQPCAGNYTYTVQSGGTGVVNFSGQNYANTPGATLTWQFGDGYFGTGATTSHTYATGGLYTVRLIINASGCVDSISKNIQVNMSGGNNCFAHYAYFSTSGSYNTQYFTNQSPSFAGQNSHAAWTFGDGASSTQLSPSHTYSSAGTYPVHLTMTWTDTFGNTVCQDTVTQNVSVAAQPNILNGAVLIDSLSWSPADTFRVWLIAHDSLNGTLTAIDSTIATGIGYAHYAFQNVAPGTYLTKAALLHQTVGVSGYVPTYHDSSLYWNQAINIMYTGGISSYYNIYMRQGVVTSGPGFVGGNISLGANKGTSGGIGGILVYLENAGGQLIASVYTDANGDYSFSNIPLGSYTIYPEAMNYITTPITGVNIVNGSISSTGNNFGQTNTEIKPKSTGILSVNGISYVAYPNPAASKVYIRWGTAPASAAVSITDIAGHKVYTAEMKNVAAVTDINVSQLQSGMYFLNIKTEAGEHTDKLIIQH